MLACVNLSIFIGSVDILGVNTPGLGRTTESSPASPPNAVPTPLVLADVSRFDKDITAAGSLGKVREQLGTGGLISAGIRSGFTGAGRFGLGRLKRSQQNPYLIHFY